jgi:phosphoglycerate dehydrogenase-like enzyme
MGKIVTVMSTLIILSKDSEVYRSIIEAARLPGLVIVEKPLPACDIAMGSPVLLRDALPELPNLNWAQSTWAGVEPLLDPSLRRDYILTNARGVFGQLMSEFVFAYLLAHERKLFELNEWQKAKQWKGFQARPLRGKTIGLLGVGSIGAEVARAAKFFGMTVRGYTRGSRTCTHIDRYYHGEEMNDFVEGLDYLVNILPNTKETRKIVDANILNSLPSHALFINVGRGSAVDESALVDALESKKLAGAILDVFEQEPLPETHPFWTTKNLRMTFHTSAPSLPEDIGKLFIENYRLYLAGKPLKYVVDFEKGY